MRYLVMTHLPPEQVLERARQFFEEHTRLTVTERTGDAIRFSGRIGTATVRVDRHHGCTNVRASTDRGVGLDVTDLTKRFLYTLEHI